MIKWIEVIVGRVIKLDPWVCLFHGSEGSYRHYKTSLIPVLLNSAKSAIPKKWQEVEGPGIRDWISRINEIYTMENSEELGPLDRAEVVKGGRWARWEAFKRSELFAEAILY